MKQKIYILGLVVLATVFAGTIFKINHWPGAAILIIAGLSSLVLLFLPLALLNLYRSEGSLKVPSLYIVTYVTCLIIFTGMLFKLLHWPYAGWWLTVALPLPYVLFLPVFLAVTSKEKNFNIYNTVFVLLLLALNSVFSGLLALNVTSDKLNDSLQLSRNYIKQEVILTSLPANNSSATVNLKIDEVIKTVNECQDLVLKLDDKTREQWKTELGIINRPDIRGSAANSLGETGEQYAARLGKELKELIELMSSTPGYQTLAENAPVIFNYNGNDPEWSKYIFNDFVAWVLIYLDGLEANLLTIKVSG